MALLRQPCYALLPKLTQQSQNALWQLVGLRHHRGTGLLQDLAAGHVGGFLGEVCIHDPATGGLGVFRGHLQGLDHRGEPVLHGTPRGAGSVQVVDLSVDVGNRSGGSRGGADAAGTATTDTPDRVTALLCTVMVSVVAVPAPTWKFTLELRFSTF